ALPPSSRGAGQEIVMRGTLPLRFASHAIGRVASFGVSRDLIIACAMFSGAALLRLPNFMTIPAITDEFKEVGYAMMMVEKNHLPLVAFDSYDGPLFPFLLSLLFRLFGYNLYLPRAFVLI